MRITCESPDELIKAVIFEAGERTGLALLNKFLVENGPSIILENNKRLVVTAYKIMTLGDPASSIHVGFVVRNPFPDDVDSWLKPSGDHTVARIEAKNFFDKMFNFCGHTKTSHLSSRFTVGDVVSTRNVDGSVFFVPVTARLNDLFAALGINPVEYTLKVKEAEAAKAAGLGWFLASRGPAHVLTGLAPMTKIQKAGYAVTHAMNAAVKTTTSFIRAALSIVRSYGTAPQAPKRGRTRTITQRPIGQDPPL